MITKSGKQVHLQDLTQIRLIKQNNDTIMSRLRANIIFPIPECLWPQNLAGR